MSLKKFASGVIIGGVMCGVTALLLAPDRGKKTRKRWAKKYRKIADGAHDLMEGACDCSIVVAKKAQGFAEGAESAARCCKKKLH